MKKFLILAGIVGAIILLAMLSKRSGSDALEVRLEEVARGRVAASVMASGKVNYRENIQLRTEVTGRIKEIHIEEGDAVKAGDTLAVISPELFEADVAQARALVETRQIDISRQQVFLAQRERQLERQKELHEAGHINQDAFETIERDVAMARLDLAARGQDLQQAKATLSSAEDRLRKTVIKAPIDGIVTALNVKAGETVVAGTTNIIGSSLMDVSDPSAVMAEVEVEEADILALALGQEADITMAAAPDIVFKGKVVSIATTAREDGSKRNSFLVKLLVDKGGEDFARLSINCRAEIFTQIVPDAVRVPVEAVLQEEAADDGSSPKSYIFVVEGGVAQKRVVEPGLQTDTTLEVKSGLNAGETLVVGPYRLLKNLRDGQAVKAEREKNAGKDDEADSVDGDS